MCISFLSRQGHLVLESGNTHTHTHTHTYRIVGCQRGLKMRGDPRTLYSSNGQADGRLLCSLCLSWWLYSSGCLASLQPYVGLRFIELSSSLTRPSCYSLLLFICTFFSILVCTSSLIFPLGLCWCLSAWQFKRPARTFRAGSQSYWLPVTRWSYLPSYYTYIYICVCVCVYVCIGPLKFWTLFIPLQ